MPQYLLSTQTLVDIAKYDGNAAVRWFEEAHLREPAIDEADVYISAVTPALLKSIFDTAAQTPDLVSLRKNCQTLVDRFVQAGQVVDVTKTIADTWAELIPMQLDYVRRDGQRKQYASGEKMVLATAIRGIEGRPFILVTRRQPAHDDLAPFGLAIEDPHVLYP